MVHVENAKLAKFHQVIEERAKDQLSHVNRTKSSLELGFVKAVEHIKSKFQVVVNVVSHAVNQGVVSMKSLLTKVDVKGVLLVSEYHKIEGLVKKR